jgi:hypothetical protein
VTLQDGFLLDRAPALPDVAPSSVGHSRGQTSMDGTAPSTPLVVGGSPSWLRAASVKVSATGSSDTLTGLAGYESETSTDGGASWSTATPGSSLVVSAEGQTLVHFRALDLAGNASGWVSATVRLDRTAPSVPTVSGGSLVWENAPSLAVSASGSSDALSGLAGYESETSTDGGASWSTPTPGASLEASAEGETLVRFRALDLAGNAGS